MAERLEERSSQISSALYGLTDALEAYRLEEITKKEEDQPKVVNESDASDSDASDSATARREHQRPNMFAANEGNGEPTPGDDRDE